MLGSGNRTTKIPHGDRRWQPSTSLPRRPSISPTRRAGRNGTAALNASERRRDSQRSRNLVRSALSFMPWETGLTTSSPRSAYRTTTRRHTLLSSKNLRPTSFANATSSTREPNSTAVDKRKEKLSTSLSQASTLWPNIVTMGPSSTK